MDQLVQIGRYPSPHGIHHHLHLFLHHLHILGHAHCIDFHFKGTASILQIVPSTRDVALVLVFLLLSAPCGQVTTILLVVISLVAWAFLASLVLLVQLLLQLLVALGELLYYCSQGLHLSFQGVGRIHCFLGDGSH